MAMGPPIGEILSFKHLPQYTPRTSAKVLGKIYIIEPMLYAVIRTMYTRRLISTARRTRIPEAVDAVAV
jgi:hypothetical protein